MSYYNYPLTTITGQEIQIDRPTPEVVSILDIGHALAGIIRYNGHTAIRQSVAEHSIAVCALVANLLAWIEEGPDQHRGVLAKIHELDATQRLVKAANPELRRIYLIAALLHDGAEAYTGDVTRHVKQYLAQQELDLGQRKGINGLERAWALTIDLRYGVPMFFDKLPIELADAAIVSAEISVLGLLNKPRWLDVWLQNQRRERVSPFDAAEDLVYTTTWAQKGLDQNLCSSERAELAFLELAEILIIKEQVVTADEIRELVHKVAALSTFQDLVDVRDRWEHFEIPRPF